MQPEEVVWTRALSGPGTGTGSGDKPVPLPTASLTASLLGTLRVEEEIKGSCPRRGVGEL